MCGQSRSLGRPLLRLHHLRFVTTKAVNGSWAGSGWSRAGLGALLPRRRLGGINPGLIKTYAVSIDLPCGSGTDKRAGKVSRKTSPFRRSESVRPEKLQIFPLRRSRHTFARTSLVANQLLLESYDKRYNPSTFLSQEGAGYRVGWYSNGYECEQRFATLADAATDYLLFSLGKSRWSACDS